MWWVKGGGGRGGRGNVRERDAGKEKNNEAKSAGSINRHDDWSDSDWVEEEGKTRREKPKLVEFIFIQTPLQHLSPYKLPIHPECLLAPSSSTTPSYPPLTLAPPPYFPSPPPLSPLPPVPLPPLLLLLCLDLGRLELPPTHPPTTLCPPASYESHGGQGPRGCQGLLMTPSPAITSGWQLYLHKTSRQRGEPARS